MNCAAAAAASSRRSLNVRTENSFLLQRFIRNCLAHERERVICWLIQLSGFFFLLKVDVYMSIFLP